jgi:hypothetical protein
MLGCNMSLRRTVLEGVGGFDDGLGRTADKPLGCEETELCIRARKLFPDGMFLLEPGSVVRHRVPEARTSWRYFLARCSAEGASKARVAERVGSQAALAEEKAYSFRTLPLGIARNLADALHGDAFGMARAAAITAGVFITAARYGGKRITDRNRRTSSTLTGDCDQQLRRRLLEPLS